MHNSLSRLFLLMVFLFLTSCDGSGGSSSTPTYSVSVTVSGLGSNPVILQNNGGNSLTVSANGAATFSTALANGATYAVTVLTQPSGLTCNVNNGAGTISGASVTNITVVCEAKQYAYVANYSDNTISAFSVNSNSGVMSSISSISTGTNPVSYFSSSPSAKSTALLAAIPGTM